MDLPKCLFHIGNIIIFYLGYTLQQCIMQYLYYHECFKICTGEEVGPLLLLLYL